MKTSFFLLASLGLSVSLQGCMTAQDRLNWDETVRWYNGTPSAEVSKDDEFKAEEQTPTEAKVIENSSNEEAPSEAKDIENSPAEAAPEQK